MTDALRTAAEALITELYEHAALDQDAGHVRIGVPLGKLRALRAALAEARQPAGEVEALLDEYGRLAHEAHSLSHADPMWTRPETEETARLRRWVEKREDCREHILALFAAREAAGRRAGLAFAAEVARDCCLVPPDRGSPTAEEREMCEHIASVILVHIEEPHHG